MNRNIFHCYEFLLLREIDKDPRFWNSIKSTILNENFQSFRIESPEFWFVFVTFTEAKDRFPSFIKKTLLSHPNYTPTRTDCILTRYLQHHQFVEMHLDNIFKHSDDCTLPKELFKCPNLKVLSLKCNSLELLPPEIGKLQKLEYLALTSNKLQNSSIPYSLAFCVSLKELLLNNNLLDALPGFLLLMPKLMNVLRHGNHNYFKATFMWYHTDINERILAIPGTVQCSTKVKSLKEICAITIIGNKMNFFSGCLPSSLVDYICSMYFDFNLCYKCPAVLPQCEPGYKVYTFKNPYLGNTCVPFLHWACCMKCAEDIEIPAREEQIMTAQEQDKVYYEKVQEAQGQSYQRSKNSLLKLNCCIL